MLNLHSALVMEMPESKAEYLGKICRGSLLVHSIKLNNKNFTFCK